MMLLAVLSVLLVAGPVSDQSDIAELAGNWLCLEVNATTLEDVAAHNAVPRKLYLSGPAGQRILLMLPQTHIASSASFVHYWRWKALLAGGEESASIMLNYAPQDCSTSGLPVSLVEAVTKKLRVQGPFSRKLLEKSGIPLRQIERRELSGCDPAARQLLERVLCGLGRLRGDVLFGNAELMARLVEHAPVVAGGDSL